MANYRSFLTGLANAAASDLKTRRDEERDLAKTMSSLIMKAQIERQLEGEKSERIAQRMSSVPGARVKGISSSGEYTYDIPDEKDIAKEQAQEVEDVETDKYLDQTSVRQKYLDRLAYARPGELKSAEARLMGAYESPNVRKMIQGMKLGDIGKEQLKESTTLRKEYETQSKDFRNVADSYTRIQQSYKDPSAAGDLALIFNYMKVLDPGSTVREGEFATAETSRGIDDITRGLYNKILRGQRLTPKQRDDFYNRAGMLYKGKEQEQSAIEDEFSRIAKGSGVAPSRVIVKYKRPSTVGDFVGSGKGGGKIPSFSTEADVMKAGLTPGTEIMINGKRAIWE